MEWCFLESEKRKKNRFPWSIHFEVPLSFTAFVLPSWFMHLWMIPIYLFYMYGQLVRSLFSFILQEHLLIVCELLKANLYEFHKFNRESGGEVYFTMPRLQVMELHFLK